MDTKTVKNPSSNDTTTTACDEIRGLTITDCVWNILFHHLGLAVESRSSFVQNMDKTLRIIEGQIKKVLPDFHIVQLNLVDCVFLLLQRLSPPFSIS